MLPLGSARSRAATAARDASSVPTVRTRKKSAVVRPIAAATPTRFATRSTPCGNPGTFVKSPTAWNVAGTSVPSARGSRSMTRSPGCTLKVFASSSDQLVGDEDRRRVGEPGEGRRRGLGLEEGIGRRGDGEVAGRIDRREGALVAADEDARERDHRRRIAHTRDRQRGVGERQRGLRARGHPNVGTHDEARVGRLVASVGRDEERQTGPERDREGEGDEPRHERTAAAPEGPADQSGDERAEGRVGPRGPSPSDHQDQPHEEEGEAGPEQEGRQERVEGERDRLTLGGGGLEATGQHGDRLDDRGEHDERQVDVRAEPEWRGARWDKLASLGGRLAQEREPARKIERQRGGEEPGRDRERRGSGEGPGARAGRQRAAKEHRQDGCGQRESGDRAERADDHGLDGERAEEMRRSGATRAQGRELATLGLGEETGGVVREVCGEQHPGDTEEQEQDLRQGHVALGAPETVGDVVDHRRRARRDPLDRSAQRGRADQGRRRIGRGVPRAIGTEVELDHRRGAQCRRRRRRVRAQGRQDRAVEQRLVDHDDIRDEGELALIVRERLAKSGPAVLKSATPVTVRSSGVERPGIRTAIRAPGPMPRACAASWLMSVPPGGNVPEARRTSGNSRR